MNVLERCWESDHFWLQPHCSVERDDDEAAVNTKKTDGDERQQTE